MIPGSVEITFNEAESDEHPVTVIFQDILQADSYLKILEQHELKILSVEVIP